MIEALPEQYETGRGRMFARGQQLSGDQWQKVALACTFTRRVPIVILDEPAASLDTESEAEIFARMHIDCPCFVRILVLIPLYPIGRIVAWF